MAKAVPRTTMEAQQVDELPRGKGWQFEPKWDGFRCLASRDGAKVELMGRSGKSLARYFPEVVAGLARLPVRRFTLDGELVIPVGKSLSFEALQMRLHPAASRIAKLAAETPALLIAFDALRTPDADVAERPLIERRAALEKLFARLGGAPHLRLSPMAARRPAQFVERDHALHRLGDQREQRTLAAEARRNLEILMLHDPANVDGVAIHMNSFSSAARRSTNGRSVMSASGVRKISNAISSAGVSRASFSIRLLAG